MDGRPVCLDDYEEYARRTMLPSYFGFFSNGADAEYTLRRNKLAYEQLLIKPKILVNVEKVDTSVNLLGRTISSPICVAPTSGHALAHHDGEKATARACAAVKTCYCMSSYSNYAMETVVEQAAKVDPNALQWFQLYVVRDRRVTHDFVKRAEKAGFKALVVTVDRPIHGRRLAEARLDFHLPEHLQFGNFGHRGANGYFGDDIDPTLCWQDIAWLKTITHLPIIVKGVMRADDAKLAIDVGVDGIIVSNHGGRQLDTCPAPLEVLPEIVEACKGTRVQVYVDGGIRRGTDVFKALALGAKAVFIGRPVLWGLAYKGEQGVKQVLQQIMADFRLVMALSGCTSIDQITSEYIVPAEDLSFSRSLKNKSRL